MESVLKHRGKKLLQGSILRTISTFLKIIIGFFMLPFLIHNLGDKFYGLWILVMSLMGYYTLLRLGLSNAVSRFLSQAVGKNSQKEMSIISSTSFFVYLIISLLMVFLTLLFILLGTSLFGNIEPDNAKLFRLMILILGINTALAPPFSVFGAILISHLQYKVSEMINITYIILLNSLIVIFIKLGKGLLYLALIYFLCNILRIAFIFFYIKRKHGDIEIRLKYFSREKFKTLFTFSIYAFISQIAETLRFKLDTIVITIFIGITAITHYNIAASVISYFSLFIMSTIGILGGYISQEEGRRDFDSIREKFVFITKINTYLCVFIGCSIIFYGKVFIQRWMGTNYTNSYNLLIILTVPSIIYLSQYSSAAVLYGISKIKFLAYSNFIEGIANLLISLILVKKYGLIGIALGTAIPMIVIKLFIQPIYINKVLKISVKDYYIKYISHIMLTFFCVFPIFMLFMKFLIPSFIVIFTLVIIQTIYFIVIIYFIGFNKKEKIFLKSLVLK